MQRFNVVYKKLYKKDIMEINKALERLEWRFKSSWKVNENDIEAFNAILKFKEQTESINLSQNDNYAKMFIHQLILLSRTGLYSGERCLEVINEILNKSVYDWSMILREEIPMIRFNGVSNEKYNITPQDILKRGEVLKRNEKIVSECSDELIKELKYEISKDDIIKFVKIEVTKSLNRFEK